MESIEEYSRFFSLNVEQNQKPKNTIAERNFIRTKLLCFVYLSELLCKEFAEKLIDSKVEEFCFVLS